jgi:hypothetical protein
MKDRIIRLTAASGGDELLLQAYENRETANRLKSHKSMGEKSFQMVISSF